MRERLIQLVERVVALDAAITKAPGAPAPFRGAPGSRPGPPASEAALVALEREVGPLPPKYRAFLALHDGWEAFPSMSGRARLFSCADFSRPETADFVARVRSARGHKSLRELQTALVIGGVEGEAFVLLAPVQRGKKLVRPEVVRSHGWSRSGLTQGDHADVAAFLEERARLMSWWLEEAGGAAPIRGEADAWACVEAAIASFNEPEENGERPDEADRALHALAARFDAASPPGPGALVARLARELTLGTYVRARRSGAGIELEEAGSGRWVRVP